MGDFFFPNACLKELRSCKDQAKTDGDGERTILDNTPQGEGGGGVLGKVEEEEESCSRSARESGRKEV